MRTLLSPNQLHAVDAALTRHADVVFMRGQFQTLRRRVMNDLSAGTSTHTLAESVVSGSAYAAARTGSCSHSVYVGSESRPFCLACGVPLLVQEARPAVAQSALMGLPVSPRAEAAEPGRSYVKQE